ncbi:DUF6476 family protein [Thioclava sp. GXIMD4216]|uniref:DUF6476 family protein n=1 Tax=Thioclava litoralis TaxID=3076557 RepID=A0ABZ1DY17_9RHOB|nr:DUF6476 family protein [Thioclava sp. FTW29]
MSDPISDPDAPVPELRFLKWLVTALAVTMIAGLLTIVTLLVIRFNQPSGNKLTLPEAISLPDGLQALSLTQQADRIIIVTTDNQVLLFSPDGRLTARTKLAP